MVFVSLSCSAVYLLFVIALAQNRERVDEQGRVRNGVFWATGVSFAAIFFCGMAWPMVGLNALAVALVGLVCGLLRTRARSFAVSAFVTTVAAYLLVATPNLLHWNRLKKEFPLESLSGRMAYEDRPRPNSLLPREDLPWKASETRREERLAALEKSVTSAERSYGFQFLAPRRRGISGSRTESLALLHAGVVKQFVASPGFGSARGFRVASPLYLEQERREREQNAEVEPPVPQPGPVYSSFDQVSEEAKPSTLKDLLSVHDDSILDFTNPQGFGYVKDRENVAGFLPHQFSRAPSAPKPWRIERVELVGILKYEEPVVYLSANLPRMEELIKAQTRTLDAFEKKALDGLLAGEDMMVQEMPKQLRLLGSIRAVEQCLRCHHVKRGELLGAFSYKMLAE